MRDGFRRRALFGVGVTAAMTTAAGGLADPAGAEPAAANSLVRNVLDYGAVGDGIADDTAAVAAACAAAGDGPLALYLPAGTYRVTQWPDMRDFAQVAGDGADNSTILYGGDGTLIGLQGRHRVRFTRMGIFLTGAKGTAVRLSACFRCSFESVLIRGNHTSDSHPTYLGQRGVVLDENTGGTTFVDCDINNFGFGLVTSCIQNYVIGSKFTSNYIGVLGTGSNLAAGLGITNTDFVSGPDPRITHRHLDIDGKANDWWLTNVWFEGADVAVAVGRAGVGGPSQFGMVNCKLAARTLCLDLQYCRQPYLANVIFDSDNGDQATAELRINAGDCPQGTAVSLISGIRSDIDPDVYPPEWQVTGRGYLYAPTGVVLRDDNGVRWRLTVGTNGSVTTARV